MSPIPHFECYPALHVSLVFKLATCNPPISFYKYINASQKLISNTIRREVPAPSLCTRENGDTHTASHYTTE